MVRLGLTWQSNKYLFGIGEFDVDEIAFLHRETDSGHYKWVASPFVALSIFCVSTFISKICHYIELFFILVQFTLSIHTHLTLHQFQSILYVCVCVCVCVYRKVLPQQANLPQGIPRRLRPRIITTFGTTRVVGRQPNAPVVFTPGEIPPTHF